MSYKEFRERNDWNIFMNGVIFGFHMINDYEWLIHVSMPSFKYKEVTDLHHYAIASLVTTESEAKEIYERMLNNLERE